MRNHFKTETFPTIETIISAFSNSKHKKRYTEFIFMYYNTLQNMSKIYGFSSIRLDFEELMCIVQRTPYSIIIELRSY